MRIFSFEVGLFILLFTECTIAENAEAAAERSYEELRGACNMEELLPLTSFPVPWRNSWTEKQVFWEFPAEKQNNCKTERVTLSVRSTLPLLE